MRDIDICTDLPRYRVWRDGAVVDEPTDISALWRDDLVTFVLGCSFSFEQALLEAGLPLRHIEQGKNVAMYRSNIQTARAGIFHGPMVVSMRPMKAAAAIRAVQVTSRFPNVHGAPVHLGDPTLIGITRPGRARLWGRGRGDGRRDSGVLGLWRHAAGGTGPGPPRVLHHPRTGRHADHRPAEPTTRFFLNDPFSLPTLHPPTKD